MFFAPLLLVVCLPIYLIDPYRLFSKAPVVPESITKYYALSVNPVLWELPAFTRSPKPNILLGDSQMNHLKAEDIERITGQEYFNLAYGGGTIRELISTFWYASQRVRLRSVYIGISFVAYADCVANRVPAVEGMIRNPLTYFVNRDVFEATWDDGLDEFLHRPISYRTTMSREDFWRYELTVVAVRCKQSPPTAYLKGEIRRIANYCVRNNIRLIFIIMPEHVDVQRCTHEPGAEDKYSSYEQDLASFGTTYDYDIPSEITLDRHNYSDPFHLTDDAGARVTQDIWSGQLRWCRKLPEGPR